MIMVSSDSALVASFVFPKSRQFRTLAPSAEQPAPPLASEYASQQLAHQAILLLNHFGVRFEGSRGFDHRHHRSGRADTRLFQESLTDIAILCSDRGNITQWSERVVADLHQVAQRTRHLQTDQHLRPVLIEESTWQHLPRLLRIELNRPATIVEHLVTTRLREQSPLGIDI